MKRLTLTVEFRLFEPVKERLVAGLAIATENASGHGMSAGGLREELLPYAMGDKSVAAVLGVAKDEPVSPLAGPRSPRFSRAGKPLELTGAELLPLAVTLPAGLRRVRDLAPPRFGVAQAGARLGSLHGRHERRTGTCAAVGFQDFETPAPEPGHKGRSRVSEFPFTVVPFACEATHKSSAPALLDGRVYLPGSLPAPCQAIPADPPCEDRVPLTTKTFLPERNLMPVKDQFELALLNSLRQRLHSRATVRLDEDFASGLENWRGGVKYWRQDAAGVRIGPLALFRPSLELTDYKLEFLGRIENRNIAWVFRAEDLNNYYAMKLKVVIAGASATVVLVRYAVIAGKEGPSVQVPLPIPAPGSTPCKVQLTVEGEEFTTFINGQKVDSWSDGRLKVGGIGFFGDTEDRPRLYWVKVSHQDDSLGRLCAQASRSLESVSTPALGVGNEQSTSENGQRDPYSRAFSN